MNELQKTPVLALKYCNKRYIFTFLDSLSPLLCVCALSIKYTKMTYGLMGTVTCNI